MFIYPEYPDVYRSYGDQELLIRFWQAADEDAFSTLFERYAHLVYGACLQVLQDTNQAQDACLTIFLRLRSIPPQTIERLDDYLFILSRNECLSRLRQQKRDRDQEADYRFWKKSTEESVEFSTIERLIYKADTQKQETAVQEAMAQLSQEQALCLRLFYEDQLPYREIAAQLSMEEKMVKSHLQNGRKRLRKLVAKALRAKESL